MKKKTNIRIKIKSVQFDLSEELLYQFFPSEEDEDEEDDYAYDDGADDAGEATFGSDENDKKLTEFLRSLTDDDYDYEAANTLELVTDGYLIDDGKRVTIGYNESEATGLDGSVTEISFAKDDPGLISMLRDGTVKTVLTFESGKRHICVYETPYMPFELCVITSEAVNEIAEKGQIYLDYLIEIKGAEAERTKFYLSIEPMGEETVLNEYDDINDGGNKKRSKKKK